MVKGRYCALLVRKAWSLYNSRARLRLTRRDRDRAIEYLLSRTCKQIFNFIQLLQFNFLKQISLIIAYNLNVALTWPRLLINTAGVDKLTIYSDLVILSS